MSNRILELRTPEIILLRRALSIYAKAYQEMMVKSKPTWEKEDLRKMISAADRLSERLLRETKEAKEALEELPAEELATCAKLAWEAYQNNQVDVLGACILTGESAVKRFRTLSKERSGVPQRELSLVQPTTTNRR